MFVVHKWENAKWWPRYCDLCLRHIDLTEATYLKPDLALWNKPIWGMQNGILDVTRHTVEPPPFVAKFHQRATGKGKGKH